MRHTSGMNRFIRATLVLIFAVLAAGAQASLITQGDFSINMQEKIFTSAAATAVTPAIELDSTVLVPTGATPFLPAPSASMRPILRKRSVSS